ncbi:hypothetical protein EON65_16975 [archaeon]|nr:MAG: hypothetical protein EON65_16975 [archaeon]
MLNERLTIVMKRASAAQENSKLLTSRLSSVERERDTLRAVIEVERQRAADMSRLAETARIESATKDIHLQRLQSELSSLTNIASVTSSPSGQGVSRGIDGQGNEDK